MLDENPLPNVPLYRRDVKKIFEDSAAKNKVPRIGIEVEKIGMSSKNEESPTYTGSNGYLAILGRLYEDLGWEIVEQKGKYILQMQRCGANLNLESDGRIELAGKPHESIHDLAREFRIHQNEIVEISKIFGVDWLGIGYHPISKAKDIEDLKDERKDLMTNYFEEIKRIKKNDYGLAWYKKTAGIHVNIDYLSEEDFANKSKVFYRLAPILVGMFANSPFSRKKFTGYMDFRYNVCINNDIPRFNIPKELYESDFSFDAWIDHVFSLEVLFLKKEDKWIKPKMSFGDFLEKGYNGHAATMEDYEMHTKSLWKDLKLKNVIELRCFDSLPPSLVPSVPALIKGIAYNKQALEAAWELVKDWTFYDYKEFQQDVARYGLQASIKGVKALDLAKELLTIAEDGLELEKILDAFGNSEVEYLEPIKEYIFVKEKSPAEWLVHQWTGEWRENFFPVFEWCQY